MEILLVLLIVLILFNLAAWRWGSDTRDNMHHPEWRRRWQRSMFL